MKWHGIAGRFQLWLLALLAVAGLLGARGARAQDSGAILVANFRGPVTPVLLSYLDRIIGDAEANGASALVLELDTPGGSVAITEQITQRLARARVPVIVYVAPSGAHASSAGTLVTLAGQAAAMAPGTTIGATSPVDSQGQDLPATMKAKETNTLVADIKNLTGRRGDRATAWAEKAVTEAAAATADEALQLGVIDAVATDVPDLLHKLDGRQVEVAGQLVTLQLSDRPIQPVELSPIEEFLNVLANPAIAAILLTLGTTGLLLELANPGSYLPGIAGAICLLLAFYALGVLEANWIGLAFVALAFVLFLVDLKAPTHGLLTFGGIISFLLGGFLLFNTPEMQVPWATLIVLALGTAAFFMFAISKALVAQHRPVTTGMESLIGRSAVVRQTLKPVGSVFVEGELWRAVVDDGPVPVGQQVIVTGYEGVRLYVRAAPAVTPDPSRAGTPRDAVGDARSPQSHTAPRDSF
jgi:membrane-bound serine protease (ClpP class)